MDKKIRIQNIILIILVFVLLSLSMKSFEDTESVFSFNNFQFTIVTIIIWSCQYLVLKGLTNRTILSISVVVAIETLYDIINFIIITIRG